VVDEQLFYSALYKVLGNVFAVHGRGEVMDISRCLICVMLFGLVVPSSLASTSFDGRYGTKCPASLNPAEKDLVICEPSLLRLMARPEDYDRKLVRIIGFLVKRNGYFVIYPGADYYRSTNGSGGVEILDDSDLSNELLRKAAGGGVNAVLVVGEFDARSSVRLASSAGMIRSIRQAYEVPFHD
jgi:hypothetical protein